MKLKMQNPYRAMGTLGVAVAFGIITVATALAQDAQPRTREQQPAKQNQGNRDATPGAQQNRNQEYKAGQPTEQADQIRAGDKSTEFIKMAAKSGVMEVKMARMGVEKAQNPSVKQFSQTLVTDHTKANQQLMQLAARKGVMLPSDVQHQLSQTEAGGLAGDKTGANPADSRTGASTDNNRFQTTPGATQDRQQVRDADKPENRDQNRAIRDEPRAVVGQQHDQEKSDTEHHEAMTKLQSQSGTEFDRAYIAMAIKHHEKSVKSFEEATQTLTDPEVKAFAATTLPTLRQHLQTARSLQTSTGASPTGTTPSGTNPTDRTP